MYRKHHEGSIVKSPDLIVHLVKFHSQLVVWIFYLLIFLFSLGNLQNDIKFNTTLKIDQIFKQADQCTDIRSWCCFYNSFTFDEVFGVVQAT